MVLRKLLACLMAAEALSGCAMQQVQPWEKDLMAKEEMQLVPDRIEEFSMPCLFQPRGCFWRQGRWRGGCGCN